MSYDSELGVQKPLGFWDPLGIVEGASQERFDRLRYVEVKHGRIAMLAVLGQIGERPPTAAAAGSIAPPWPRVHPPPPSPHTPALILALSWLSQ